jgi:hypothetical protein
MERDTAWEWSIVGDGHTEGNGHRDLKAGMELGKPPLPTPSMKVLGPTVYRMAMVLKHTQMEVIILLLVIEFYFFIKIQYYL